jgi:hypothetical protein
MSFLKAIIALFGREVGAVSRTVTLLLAGTANAREFSCDRFVGAFGLGMT